MEEPFGKSQLSFFYSSQIFLTFPLAISSLSHSTPLCHHHRRYTCWIPPSTPTPVPSSPHSHNDACQEFTNLQPTLMIPQAIFHKSINQIFLEHRQFLHMIPFVDAPGIPGGAKLPPCPGTGGLSKGGHHRDSLKIPQEIKNKDKTFCNLFTFYLL
ncbi:hypothetical protein O181_012411 [Austropuccinia psidii MF-1]|uniref:Uncharacterized protein n=1 Tax=Austropuccinia psidii MF-1 TaxID=1389203 RepID=A0A9Q3BUL2_9BASI|nr:hypothetical protein [Austropuccinia psidii MF-1]